MGAVTRRRLFFQITTVYLLVSWSNAAPDKLSPNQKAPVHARGSGGSGQSLALPSGGSSLVPRALTPANVGRLPSGGAPPSPAPKAAAAPAAPREDPGVQREESTSFKEVNGETVRSVVGSYGYQSPEGLPVSFKYAADENGNKASFTIGAAAGGGGAGGSGSRPRPPSGSQKPGGGGAGGGAGAGAGRGGAGGAAGAGGAGGAGGDRKYLPPT